VAQKFLTPIDLTKLELQNASFQKLAAAPANPVLGQFYYNTGDSLLYVCTNATGPVWTALATGQGHALVTLDAAADVLLSLTGQQLGLDSQAAHTVLAGPASGSAAPTFRTLADADIPTEIMRTSARGAANGVASLDANSKAPSSQLPAIAITDVSVVADAAARDALTAEEGDVAIVTGLDKTFIYDGSAWQELATSNDTITLSGDVTGSGSSSISTTIGAGKVTDTHVAAANKDGLAAAPSLRTLGTGAQQAAAGNHNHDAAYAASGHNHNGTYMRRFTQTIGDGAATSFTLTHSLGSQEVLVQVRDATTNMVVYPDVQIAASTVVITFATAPASNAYKVVILG